jgi:ubiquinone/menaquinone biosynthesis C-methylase UbiE
MQTQTTQAVDWADWARRWDLSQASGIVRREERFKVMLDLVEELVGPEPSRLLDLACGTGSISARALARFASARLVAVDVNPLLLAIGQGAQGDAGGRLRWVRADLSQSEWPELVGSDGPFDAVLSSTALHWLPAADLVAVYQALGRLIRPGGAFLNAEHLLVSAPDAPLSRAAEAVRRRSVSERPKEGESYAEWWEAAKAEPSLAELFAEHQRIFPNNGSGRGQQLSSAFHEAALRQAGFADAGVGWRVLDTPIVAAVR